MSEILRFGTYEEAERHWAAGDKHHYRDLIDGLAFRTKAFDLIQDLEALSYWTGDARFRAAIEALSDHKLINAYHWTGKTPHLPLQEIDQRYERTAASVVQLLVEDQVSLRLATATCVANLGWPGNSFAAAVKAVERLWRASTFDPA